MPLLESRAVGGVLISVKVAGLDRMSQDLTKLTVGLRDATPILKLVGLLGVRAVQRNFDRSQAPDGSTWKPLKLRSGRPLVDTAAMRNGINFDLPTSHSVRVGASSLTRSRNAIHNYGGKSGRGQKTTTPKREYMGFTAEARAELVAAARAQVVRMLKVGH